MFKIIKIALSLLILYALIITAIPWVKYFIYKNSAVKIIAENYKSIDATKKLLLEHAKELNIPLKTENIEITSYEDNRNKVVVIYTEKVKFPIINKEVVFDYEIKKDTYLKGEE